MCRVYTAEDNALAHDRQNVLRSLKAAFAIPHTAAPVSMRAHITGMRYIMKHASAMRDKWWAL